MLTDAHAHLQGFKPEVLEQMLEKAKQVGVGIIITAGMTPESSAAALRLANAHDIVYAAVGVHPRGVKGILDDETYETLRDLALENEKVVAISETGLDFADNPNHKKQQMDVFRQFIRMAREVNKPLIIHSIGAHDEVIRILKEEKADEVGGADHWFMGTLEMAKDYLDLGFYISFGTPLAKPENEALHEVAKAIPINRILIETDTSPGYPTLQPARVLEVAEKLAELKGLTLEDIEQVTTENLRRLTGIWR